MTYRSPDETRVRRANDNRNRNSSLLLCLSAGSTNPPENDTINSISSNSENNHADVACSSVVDCESKYESKNGDSLSNCDVPGSLIELS